MLEQQLGGGGLGTIPGKVQHIVLAPVVQQLLSAGDQPAPALVVQPRLLGKGTPALALLAHVTRMIHMNTHDISHTQHT